MLLLGIALNSDGENELYLKYVLTSHNEVDSTILISKAVDSTLL